MVSFKSLLEVNRTFKSEDLNLLCVEISSLPTIFRGISVVFIIIYDYKLVKFILEKF